MSIYLCYVTLGQLKGIASLNAELVNQKKTNLETQKTT